MAARRIKSVGSPSDDLPRTTWQPEDLPIGIESKDFRCIKRLRLFANWWCTWSDLDQRIFIGRHGTPVEELHDRGPIKPRSRRDRAAIGLLSASPYFQAIGERSTAYQDFDRGPIVARSWPDRGTSWGENRGHIEAKSKQNWGWFQTNPEATSSCHETAATTHGFRPTTASTAHDSGPISSLKACISLSCSSTFDRLMKKLSEFRGRSLVHRVPPAFRLDCEAIGAGLITNFSLISSNFPLEFRTSTRKNPSKFPSIHENWSSILAAIGLVVRFDRLSGGNLSFY